jgi:hypothetical protein
MSQSRISLLNESPSRNAQLNAFRERRNNSVSKVNASPSMLTAPKDISLPKINIMATVDYQSRNDIGGSGLKMNGAHTSLGL